jgi:hypothetical protein
VDFTPPSYGGTTFTSTHEHYVTIAGGAFTTAVFTDAAAELREHGHEPPYEFFIGASDEAAVVALAEFLSVNEALINAGLSVGASHLQRRGYQRQAAHRRYRRIPRLGRAGYAAILRVRVQVLRDEQPA